MSPLPFEKVIYFDFYDGPLAGYAMCSVCHQCFHFRVLKWDTHMFCRVFGFVPIEMDFDRVDRDIEQWTKNTVHTLEERRNTDNDDLPIPKQTDYVNQIELIVSRLEFSHICVTQSYLDKGYWWKMDESDKDVEDWFEHLGVVYDFSNFIFHLGKFHSI